MGSNNVRDIIFYGVYENIEKKDFFVVNADFTGRPFIDIKKSFPERFVQVGIAEQNMLAVASGLALTGKKVLTYSPNPFEYLRGYDQLRNAVSAMNLPIAIVANGMGLVNTGLGITHFTTEDYQLFSLLPNMEIFTVVDERMAKRVTEYILDKNSGPTYIRIDFNCDGYLTEESCDFEKGYRYLKKGKEVLFITQGYAAKTALNTDFTTNPAIIEIFRRPFDKEAIVNEMKKYKRVIVVEEQQLRGGLGSELLEILNDYKENIHLERCGIDYGKDLPHTFGAREYWMKKFGIDEAGLKDRAEGNI